MLNYLPCSQTVRWGRQPAFQNNRKEVSTAVSYFQLVLFTSETNIQCSQTNALFDEHRFQLIYPLALNKIKEKKKSDQLF